MADGTLHFDTKIDNSGFEKGLSKLQGIAKSSFDAIGVSIAAASTAVSAGAAAVVECGSVFETSMAKASTLFGDVAVDAAHLNSEILALSNSTGRAASTFGEALYSALSAGIAPTEDMSDALNILESSAKLATAGFTDIDTAMSATAKTLNAYGLGVEEAERIQGILIQTQNKGITTVGELGASLSQVTPTAAAFGVSFEQVGAALAVMTAQGTSTAQATTQLNAIIAELGKSGTVAAKNLAKAAQGTEYAGMTFTEMMDAGADLGDVLAIISAEADESGLSMVDMFSSIEAGKAALSIFSQEGAVFAADMEAMANTAGLVDDAFDKMMDTFEGQKSVFMESGKNLAIAVYNGMDGELTNLMKLGNDMLAQLAEAFETDGAEGLIAATGSVIGQVVVKAAEYSPMLAEAAVSLLTSFADTLISNAPVILSAGTQVARAFIAGLFGNEIADAFGGLSETALETFELLINVISGTASSAGPLLGDIAVMLLNVANVGLKPINAVLGFVANNTELVTAAVVGGVAAWGAYLVVTKASKAVSAMSKAMTLLKTATDAQTLSTMLSNGAMTIGQVVIGVLTGSISLATVAQWLWNAAMNANPVFLIITGLVMLVAAIAGVTIATRKSTDETEENTDAVDELTGNVRSLTDAQWELYDAYDSLKPQIADVNSALSDSGRTMSDVEKEMSGCEEAITTILGEAISERRALRDEDLAALDEYLERYSAAIAEKLDMYTDVQTAENERLKYMPIEDAEDAAQAWKNLAEARDQALEASRETWTAQYTMLENQLQAGYFATDAEFQAAVQALSDDLQEGEAAIWEAFNEGAAIVQEFAVDRFTTALDEFGNPFATVVENFDGQALVQLKSDAEVLNDVSAMLGEIDTAALSDGFYTLFQAIESGSGLSEEARRSLAAFLQPFSGLDGEMGEMGKNVLLGLIGGLEDEIPGLANASEMGCDEILDTLINYFGIHSPSTLMREKGGYIIDGLIEGMSDRRGALSALLTEVAGEMSQMLDAGMGFSGILTSAGGLPSVLGDYLSPLADAGRVLQQATDQWMTAQLGMTQEVCETVIAQTNAVASSVISSMQQTAAAAQSAANRISYYNTSQSLNFYTPTAKPSAVARAARSALEVK